MSTVALILLAALLTRKIMTTPQKSSIDILAESIEDYNQTLGEIDDENEQHKVKLGDLNDKLMAKFKSMHKTMEDNFVALQFFRNSSLEQVVFYRCTSEQKQALIQIQSSTRFVVREFTTNIMQQLMEEDLDALEDASDLVNIN